MLLDEAEPHFGISAKMPIAFFRTSRSIRVRSSSRRSRAISAAWSDGEARGLVGDAAGNAPGCDRAAAPRRIARHCLSIEGLDPELGCNLHLRSAAAFQQRHRLSLELGGELPSRLRHQITFLAPQERIRGVRQIGGGSARTTRPGITICAAPLRRSSGAARTGRSGAACRRSSAPVQVS